MLPLLRAPLLMTMVTTNNGGAGGDVCHLNKSPRRVHLRNRAACFVANAGDSCGYCTIAALCASHFIPIHSARFCGRRVQSRASSVEYLVRQRADVE